MKCFLQAHENQRYGHAAWALKKDSHILRWTTSTTREEVRQIKHDQFGREGQMSLFGEPHYEIVKVNIKVKEIA